MENAQKRLIISAYGVDNKPFFTKFKFQKTIFLAVLSLSKSKEEAIKILDYLSFYPHKYGPYSEFIEQIREDLIREKVLKPISDRKEILSDKGKEIYLRILRSTDPRKIRVLQNIKEMINVPIKDEILALLVYDIAEKYGYTIHSRLNDQINKNRIKYAIILYNAGIVSKERASELARMPPIDFYKLLMEAKNNEKTYNAP